MLNQLQELSVKDIHEQYGKNPNIPKITDDALKNAMPGFRWIVGQNIWYLNFEDRLSNHLMAFTISNNGNTTVRNIQCVMRQYTDSQVIIDRGDMKKDVVHFGSVLKLGDLSPGLFINLTRKYSSPVRF